MKLEERDIQFGDLRVHIWEGGTGFPIVIIHGSGPGASTLGNWNAVLQPLAERYHIIASDLVGFGLSERKPSTPYFDFNLWLSQAEFLVEQFTEQQVGIIGHSLSGAIALKVAANNKRISKVLTTGTMGTRFSPNEETNRVWTFPATREDLKRTAETLIFDKDLITKEYIDNRMKVLHSGDYRQYFETMFAGDKQKYIEATILTEDELTAIAADVTMIHGRQDVCFPYKDTTLPISCHLPQADVLLLGRCRHSPALEHPERFMSCAHALFG